MSKEQSKEAQTQVSFNLKHRLAGAAVLIFFGVLVLPWMLGPPNSSVSGQDALAARDSELDKAVEAEVAQLEGDFLVQDDIEETVYISKITPLDAQNASASKPVDPKPVAAEPKSEVSEPEVIKDKSEEESNSNKELSKVDASEKSVEDVNKEDQVAIKSVDSSEAQPSAPVAQREIVPDVSSPLIEVGWVVQVGLFSTTGFEERAEKLVAELIKDGFKADSTVVDTNKGRGMRVWLGPFSKRVQASNEVERLKGVTGKSGFVRVYP